MYKGIATGVDDFKEIIEGNYLFIDKTLFIKEIINNGDKVILFPRPRRFGKTLNLSMLSYYFDITLDSKKLFKNLNITHAGKEYLSEMNKYPVIYLTLKNCKRSTFEEFKINYKEIISDLYKKYAYILKSKLIEQDDKEYFEKCKNGQEEDKISLAISKLSTMLETYYNRKVIVLLDEYDSPILNSYLCGYYDECINFMKEVFLSTFKNNLSLKKGVITGILRISKEGMFSDANNISIYNTTDVLFDDSFGFTSEETKNVLKLYDIENTYNNVKKWYDGYLFGDKTIYNPWSILNLLKDPKHEFKPFWVNTGGVGLLKDIIYNTDGNVGLLEEYHKLLETKKVEHIDLNLYMNIKDMKYNRNTTWSLFMQAGYLTPTKFNNNNFDVDLKIPNLEIEYNLKNICINWFNKNIKNINYFDNYFITNNMNNFKDTFIKIVESSFSYYDVGINNGENFYHAFTMGLLYSGLNNFNIKSNREIGYGRYDLIITPKNNSCCNSYIIEFKAIDNNNFNKTIKDAFKQINDKKYDIELKEKGYKITKIVIVFKGKEVKIEIKK